MPDTLLYTDTYLTLSSTQPQVKVGDQLKKPIYQVATGLTAHAGGGQTSALVLTAPVNVVSTVGTAADSVALPPAVAGMKVTVVNSAATNSMQVFGSGTDTINGIATGTGVAQAAGKTADYYCAVSSSIQNATAGAWFRLLSA
jgi:hypothetical protein